MKAPIKCKNDLFQKKMQKRLILVMPFKHVPTVMGFVDCTGTTSYGQ
jgi:hypothetical protein